ncbi:MAG: ThuA domain-containing protein [Planctomycetaceae bacterium]
MIRLIRRTAVALLCAALFAPAVAVQAEAPKKPAKVLFVTQSKGFRHGSVHRKGGKLAPAEVAIVQLGQQTGLFQAHCTQDCAADFTRENLKKYDIVMFYTTGELPITRDAREYFLNDWLKTKGHGFLGFHSATDTYRSRKGDEKQNERYRWYWDMIGGTFNGHPWNSRNTVTVSVHDTKFPAMKPFGKEFQIKDEIYQYRNWQPKNVHVLMSLNMEKCRPQRPYHVPVAWCRNWGDGRIFVNNLGHNPGTWTDKRFLKSTELAVRWVLGLETGDARPNPKVSAEEERKAKAAAN